MDKDNTLGNLYSSASLKRYFVVFTMSTYLGSGSTSELSLSLVGVLMLSVFAVLKLGHKHVKVCLKGIDL